MNLAASAGITVGLIVGLVIAFVLLKVANTNHRAKTEYDERQQLIRGKGYMYAFYTAVFYQIIMMILSIGGIELPMERYAQDCLGFFLGFIVLAVYCIWNDVYWGLNNNKKTYIIIFIVATIFNIIPVVGPAMSGTLVEDGKIGLPIINIMALTMIAIIGIEFLIKKIVSDKAPQED